jgi:hypothetical protein
MRWAAMAQYTFSIEADDLRTEHVEERAHESDEVAVRDAAKMLGPGHIAVSLGRGTGDEVEWLGAWDWCEGEPRWSAEE